jgi:thioredoxin:protein disulfide reductase
MSHRHCRVPVALIGALAALGAAAADTGATSGAVAQGSSGSSGVARALGLGSGPANAEFLPVERAFRLFGEAAGADRARLTWEIAPGYYLYRSRIKVVSGTPNAQLGTLALPEGQSKKDEFFGVQQVYHNEIVADLPIRHPGNATVVVPIKVTYQGCAEAGLCYPPQTKTLSIVLPAAADAGAAPGSGASPGPASGAAAGGSPTTTASGPSPTPPTSGAPAARASADLIASAASTTVSDQDYYASVIQGRSLPWVLAVFFAVGVGLAFTPCVLPMVPIVSGLILGQGRRLSTARALALSATYVLGMAITYTAAGMAVAAGGKQVQAAFQQPWIIALFAAVFVVLALSMFGMFTLQMPAAVQTRLASLSNRQSAGSFGGVAIMGALSALIVTTCVAPALVGALLFIGQSGNLVRGGAALFAMGLGMGAPLLVVGASAGRLLPRAGAWMDIVKHLFGAMMLAVSVWMLTRIVPERFTLFLWAIPAGSAAIVLWMAAPRLRTARWPMRVAGGIVGAYALVLLAGAALGASDPLAPLPQLEGQRHELAFQTIKSVADLDREVALAQASGRPVMLDFYADWCVSCKEMAKYTFTDPRVQHTLERTVLLRADVTRNDEDDQALLKRFGIFGPPTIAFYGPDGTEHSNLRVVGYMKAPDFVTRAQLALHGLPRTAQAGAS